MRRCVPIFFMPAKKKLASTRNFGINKMEKGYLPVKTRDEKARLCFTLHFIFAFLTSIPLSISLSSNLKIHHSWTNHVRSWQSNVSQKSQSSPRTGHRVLQDSYVNVVAEKPCETGAHNYYDRGNPLYPMKSCTNSSINSWPTQKVSMLSIVRETQKTVSERTIRN